MTTITLTGQGGKLLERLARRSTAGELFSVIEQFMLSRQSRLAGFVVRSWNRKGNTRTGSLVRSIDAAVFRDEAGLPALEVGVLRGPAQKYAGIQEHGTKSENPDSPYPRFITPKKGKALAMPVGDALTPAGVARYEGPRNYPEELTFIPIQRGDVAGRLVLTSDIEAARALEGEIDYSTIESLYILLYRARIPAKFYIRDGVRRFMPQFAADLANELVKEFAA